MDQVEKCQQYDETSYAVTDITVYPIGSNLPKTDWLSISKSGLEIDPSKYFIECKDQADDDVCYKNHYDMEKKSKNKMVTL